MDNVQRALADVKNQVRASDFPLPSPAPYDPVAISALDAMYPGKVISFYATGTPGKDWEDLCRGPHVPSTGRIGAIKVMSVAGAYWHGDENAQQLQRVYGTAFPSQKDLDTYLNQIEEAKKRDHRVIGKQMGLFTISNLVGSGLILWMPKGAIIRQELEGFMREELAKRNYVARLHPAHRQSRSLQNLRPLPLLPGIPVPHNQDEGARQRRRIRVPAQADELPAPHQDLRLAAAFLPRPAGAPGRVRHGLPLGAIRRTQRHDPRPRIHPGRRPPVLHRGAGRAEIPAASRARE